MYYNIRSQPTPFHGAFSRLTSPLILHHEIRRHQQFPLHAQRTSPERIRRHLHPPNISSRGRPDHPPQRLDNSHHPGGWLRANACAINRRFRVEAHASKTQVDARTWPRPVARTPPRIQASCEHSPFCCSWVGFHFFISRRRALTSTGSTRRFAMLPHRPTLVCRPTRRHRARAPVYRSD